MLACLEFHRGRKDWTKELDVVYLYIVAIFNSGYWFCVVNVIEYSNFTDARCESNYSLKDDVSRAQSTINNIIHRPWHVCKKRLLQTLDFLFPDAMSWLASFILLIVHQLYALASLFSKIRRQLFVKSSPLPLDAPRKLLPNHIAIIFFAEDGETRNGEEEDEMLIETICKCVDWCQTAGIARLSVYDRYGTWNILVLLALYCWIRLMCY